MENNLQNAFFQIQNLLNELNTHLYKVNEIFFQMNNIIKQINIPMINEINNKIIKMNNNMGEIMNNQIYNNMNNIQFQNQLNKEKINFDENIQIGFRFKKPDADFFININKKKTINELLNLFLKKINKTEYIDNYKDYFTFLFNAEDIQEYKNKKIEEVILKQNMLITVITTSLYK